MKEPIFNYMNKVSTDVYKTISDVEELLASDINVPQERFLHQALYKLLECSMHLSKAIEKGQRTLFDNLPPQENPNQGRLFDDNMEPIIVEEPKEMKPKIKKEKTAEVIEEKKADVKLPSKEDVIFMAKEYSKKHGSGEAFLKVLETFGATKISEVYAKGDAAVMNLVDAIRI